MRVKCDKCRGTGELEYEPPKLSLEGMLEPFISGDTFGFRIKAGSPLEPLKPLNYPDVAANAEAFQAVAAALHGKE